MITSFPSSPWVRVEKKDGSQTIVRCRSFRSRNLLIRSRSSMGEWFSESKGKSMISFQSSPDRNDSSGKIRTFVKSTSQVRLLRSEEHTSELQSHSFISY